MHITWLISWHSYTLCGYLKGHSMPYIEKEVEVWVDLEDFDDDELLKEMQSRDIAFSGGNLRIIQQIYDAYRLDKDYDDKLRELFYNALGRIA